MAEAIGYGRYHELNPPDSGCFEARYDIAKGGDVLKDSSVKNLADELGRNFNEDPALILGQLAEVGEKAKEMVPFMEAGMRISNKMFQDADALASRIRNGALEEFDGNAAAANQALKKRITAAVDVMASVESILSNSGRSLRRARSEFRNTAEDLADSATYRTISLQSSWRRQGRPRQASDAG
ncbi:hypothetical protein HGG76_02555 [Ochrobactrum tritici]|uniref:Uncharacterized protein n=1 Tax=Brucella tritici TaxID=94626 RepID=A0A7X6FNN6_9HYPH|nr:hypothetical protein [Brucella tritici]